MSAVVTGNESKTTSALPPPKTLVDEQFQRLFDDGGISAVKFDDVRDFLLATSSLKLSVRSIVYSPAEQSAGGIHSMMREKRYIHRRTFVIAAEAMDCCVGRGRRGCLKRHQKGNASNNRKWVQGKAGPPLYLSSSSSNANVDKIAADDRPSSPRRVRRFIPSL